MTKTVEHRRAKSAILDAVHEGAAGLYASGFIDKRRMSMYEALCLEPVPEYSSAQIRALRTSLELSQPVHLPAVLAQHLHRHRAVSLCKGIQFAGDQLDEGRLAAAVGAEQGGVLALRDA